MKNIRKKFLGAAMAAAMIPSLLAPTATDAAFADNTSAVESHIVATYTPHAKHLYEVKVHQPVDSEEDSSYDLSYKIKNGLITFTLVTEPGTVLGNVENSQNIIDSKKELEDGRTEYKFHFTLIDRNIHGVINIYLSSIK